LSTPETESLVRRTRYARNGPQRIAYELRGRWGAARRRPWLVLIHGVGMDRSGWAPVLDRLRRRFRLVLIDNRGSGRSRGGLGPYEVRDVARDVVAVLDHARIDRAHVLGASLGGMVAQELAVRYPERADRLVLLCTTPGWPFAYPMPAPSVELLAARHRLPRAVARRRNVENALSPRTVQHAPELVARLVEYHEARPVDPHAWTAQMSAGAGYVGNLDQTRIRAHTLVLHGSADRVVDPRNARLLADRIPSSELVILPDLGHLLWWEDPDGVAAHITSFLRQPADRAAVGVA
jgi:3-oxoadipate enol-lactonase